MPFSRRLRDRGKRGLHRAFRLGQRIGVDVLPRHFYSSVPDVRELTTGPKLWRQPLSMAGVAGIDLDTQLTVAQQWFTPEVRADLAASGVHAAAVAENEADGYGPMEAQFLHAFVATERPARIVQVGAGVSTAIILAAAAKHGVEVDVVAVDPFPTPLLERLAGQGAITLLREPAQSIDLTTFTSLGAGDLLFIDSTHTVKAGSEVNRIVLEVFPQLNSGVTVHVHDIMFPYDYPPDLLLDRLFFWNESTLLHAYLIGNAHASIVVSQSMLAHGRSDALREMLAGYKPARMTDGLFVDPEGGHFPSATWFRTH